MDLKGAIDGQVKKILAAKRADCENTLKNWGFSLDDKGTELLIDVALLMHLDAPEASAAITKAKAQCKLLVEKCCNSNEQMQEDLWPSDLSVESVIQFMVTALDYFIFTTTKEA